MKKQTLILLGLIIIIAFVLRFYKLGVNPPSLSWDEASIGYNAYSIAQTLKDEHGRFLPVDYFSAFGDYKPPVAIYLTALSVKIFGFSDWAVRFPSAFLGTLTVLLTFFLVEELRKYFNSKSLTSRFPLLSSFILAISPWHTILSRQMFEANIAQFFIVLGTLFLLKGLQQGRFLLWGISSLVISLYTFNSTRLFLPLFLGGFVILTWHNLWQQKKYTLLSLILGLLLVIPLIPHLMSPLGQLRFKEVNIFSDASVVLKSNERIALDDNAWWSKIIHNRRIGYGLLFLTHYFDHFNIDYLFFNGDINPKFSTRTNGQFFVVEVVFLVAGLYFLVRKERKLSMFVLMWLLLGLIPAATARETPHALRTEVSLPAWQIISAAGLYYLYGLFVNKWKQIFISLVIMALSWEIFIYLHNYYVHYPQDFSQDWQYGYKLAAREVESYKERYDKIWVTEKYGRPYIFFLTYQKYDPRNFQINQKVTIDVFGFYRVLGYDKYVFGAQDFNSLKGKKTLLIGAEGEIPNNAKKIKDIYFLNGEKALEIAEM